MKKDKQQEKSPKKRRNKEKLTVREIEDLMGMHKDVYTRRHGAIRNK
ncbi:hypothetical protein J1P26_07375 [Neobacillus sp. MM2021_6]|nr:MULTISPECIES: hypothetical protein [Bacillaceae]MBO0959553.1 hypothetical protein [Neobacillus sp. MM2021_6]NHC17149.1 hypothetical protein [Bacillus sp. MM2020_4]